MNAPTVQILSTAVSRAGLPQALTQCEERVTLSQGGYVCFVNVHTATEAIKHPGLKAALDQATYNFADGVPIVWASQMLRKSVGSRVCGPDFTTAWFRKHAQEKVGLIGGAPGRAEIMAKNFGIQAICYSPPLRDFSPENATEDWLKFLKICPGGKAPTTVWIGLGAPKQELWMQTVSKLAPQTVFFGIGAAFDFLSGGKSRAPLGMQKAGLEWFYRLCQEPTRLAGRYFATNTCFIWKFFLQILGGH